MASKIYCDVCTKRNKTSAAMKFCSDCEDNLCSECLEVHAALKCSAKHHIIDVGLDVENFLNVKYGCDKHAESPLEFYCSDHDLVCCRSCMTNEHRTCEKLTPIEVAASNVKSSIMFEDVSNSVERLQQVSSQLTESGEKSTCLMKESKRKILEKVSKLKGELHRRIDEMNEKCIADLDSIFSDLIKKDGSDKKEVENRVQTIQKMLEKFEVVSKHGSNRQIFLLLHSLKMDLRDVDADLKEFIPSLKTRTVNFEESDVLKMLASIGSVKVTEKTCDVIYQSMKETQAQLNLQDNPVPKKLNFKLESRITIAYDKRVAITGMCVTRYGRIILCNYNQPNLLVLTDSGQYIQDVNLGNYSWNIVIDPGTDDAWMTLPLVSYLQIIDTKSLSLKQKVNVSVGCYGIAFVDDNVAVSMSSNVDIMTKQGARLKSLKVGSTTIYSLCYTGKNQLYCCEANKDIFHCLSLDGTDGFLYKSAALQGPICVNTDHQGNMYVLCYRSNNLHKLSADGKLLGIVTNANDGLERPYAACFHDNYFKMCIANYSNKEILILSSK